MGFTFSFSARCGSILLLFLLSVLIAACGGGTGANVANLGDPQATTAINMGAIQSSPTPALPGEWCGAWVTNPTPSYAAGMIAVYAKFTKNVDGNPAGIGDATATAHVLWTPSDSDTYTATTTSDGLAVFPVSVANRSFAVNTITLVTVTFQKAGVPDCTVGQDRAAFFTLIYASPIASGNNTPTPRQNATPPAHGGPTPPIITSGTPGAAPTVKPGH